MIIQVGSKKEELQKEALTILVARNIMLEPEWIPREIADYLSRIVDYDDWGLSGE